MKDYTCFQGLSPRLIEAMEASISSSPAALALVDGDGIIHVASPSLGTLVGIRWQSLLGKSYLDLFASEQQLVMAERLKTPPDPQFFFPTRLQHQDGSTREVDARAYRLDIPDEVWTTLILVDVTTERRLLRKLGGISVLASSLTLTYAGGLRKTLDSLTQRVVDTTEAIACSVFVCDEQADEARFRLGGAYGVPLDALALTEKAITYSKEAESAGIDVPVLQTRRTRQPVIVTDFHQRIRENMAKLPEPMVELAAMAEKQAWKSIVVVPILLANRYLGTLNCYYRTPMAPEQAELTFLRTLADLASVAIENARLAEKSEQQAILQERRRLARELHDSVSQALYGISLGAKTVKVRWQSQPEKAQLALDYVIELAEGAAKEMRALLYSIRPESLDEEGLVQALQRQAEALKARYGIQVSFTAPAEPNLHSSQRLVLFRVASESLHNVVKHSGAKQVQVRLQCDDTECLLEVSDDGLGFDVSQNHPDRYGLTTMRERVEGVGGEWELRSKPGQGTKIRARLPLLRQAARLVELS